MSGGAWEYVMGNYTTDTNLSQTTNNPYNNGEVKTPIKLPYVDLYNITSNNNCTWNTGGIGCGGHALFETASWGGDGSGFVYSYGPWFIRGGSSSTGSSAGVFASGLDLGNYYADVGFRAALLPNTNSGSSTVPSEIAVTNVDPASISIAKLAMGSPVYFYLNGNNLTKLSRVVLTGVQYPDLTQELSCHADLDTQAECYIRQWDGSNGYPAQDYSATFYGYNDEILHTMDVFVSVTGQMG